MGKNIILNNKISHVSGLQIGDNASTLLNISTNEITGLTQLDYTLYAPEFQHDPKKTFNSKFLNNTANLHNDTSSIYKAIHAKDAGTLRTFGQQLKDMTFNETEERPGLMMSWVSDRNEGGKIVGTYATPVLSKREKLFTFDEANKLFEDEDIDPALEKIFYFIKDATGTSPYQDKYFQATMDSIKKMHLDTMRKLVFENSIETMLRVDRQKLNKDTKEAEEMNRHLPEVKLDQWERKVNYISTSKAQSTLPEQYLKVSGDISSKSSAIYAVSSTREKILSGDNMFDNQQMGRLGEIHHYETQLSYYPSYTKHLKNKAQTTPMRGANRRHSYDS